MRVWLRLLACVIVVRTQSDQNVSTVQEKDWRNATDSPDNDGTDDDDGVYQPHILFVVMDDLGSNDLGYHGSGIHTPVADSIARDGLRFRNFYTLPTCSTTRMALMTGRYPYRFGQYEVIRSHSTKGMPLDEETLPEVLRRAGYQAHAIGKWHLGHARKEQTPTYRGFQSFFGFHVSGMQGYFSHHTKQRERPYDLRDEPREFCGGGCSQQFDARGEYSSTLYGRRAAKLIKNYDKSEGPLFLYLAFQAGESHIRNCYGLMLQKSNGNLVHTPLEVPNSYMERYSRSRDLDLLSGTDSDQRKSAGKSKFTNKVRRTYSAMLTAADEGLGLVVDALKDSIMWQDTLIIYMTDNGGAVNGKINYKGRRSKRQPMADNSPSRGGKMDVWEGGVLGEGFIGGGALRTLGIKNGRHRPTFHTLDWLPTLVDMTGATRKSKKELDGLSQLSVLQGGEPRRKTYFLGYSVTRASDQGKRGTRGELTALRHEDWKLIRKENRVSYELYNLRNDPGESMDISKKNRALVQRLAARMRRYERDFTRPAEEDKRCPHLSFAETSWRQKCWKTWCSE